MPFPPSVTVPQRTLALAMIGLLAPALAGCGVSSGAVASRVMEQERPLYLFFGPHDGRVDHASAALPDEEGALGYDAGPVLAALDDGVRSGLPGARIRVVDAPLPGDSAGLARYDGGVVVRFHLSGVWENDTEEEDLFRLRLRVFYDAYEVRQGRLEGIGRVFDGVLVVLEGNRVRLGAPVGLEEARNRYPVRRLEPNLLPLVRVEARRWAAEVAAASAGAGAVSGGAP